MKLLVPGTNLLHLRQCIFLCLSLLLCANFRLLILHQHLGDLLLQGNHLEVHVLQRFLRFLSGFRFLRQLCLRIQLCLSYFLDKYLTDFHILQVIIIHNFFLDLFDKLGLYGSAFFAKQLFRSSGVGVKKTLKYCIIGNQVGIHLDQIFLIKLESSILHLNGITYFIVILQKLPELIAGPVIRILHNQVRSLDWASHLGAAGHQSTESGILQRHYHTSYTVDSHEDIHIVRIILCKALAVFHLHFNLVLNLLIGIIHLTLIAEYILGFIPGCPENDIRTFIDEGYQTLNQMIDKAVFIQIIAFLRTDIQHTGRLNVSVLTAGDELRIHAQMPYTVRSDFPGKCHRHNLLLGGHKTTGLLNNVIDGIQTLLNHGKPAFIHYLM